MGPSTATFETVGTLFDALVHLVNAYLLASHMSSVEVILGIALVHLIIQALLYNPRYVKQLQLVTSLRFVHFTCR